MRVKYYIGGFFCSILIFSVVAAHGYGNEETASPQSIQKNRTATMKSINKNMRQIKVFIGNKQFNLVSIVATDVADRIAKIPDLSPEGSGFGRKSRIKPGVWENFAHYKELAERSSNAARSLAKAAQGTNQKEVMGSFVSLARTCSKCHKPYRKKKRQRR